jgi:chloramphenicol-sensitive protein RarD
MESTFRQGIIYSLTAYLLWGILPIYWKTLGVVQAFEILSNRFIWSCVFVWILIIASGRVKSFLAETQDIFTNPKQALRQLRSVSTGGCLFGLSMTAE